MSYSVSVPIINAELARFGGRDAVLAQLRRLGAGRVLLATGELLCNSAARAQMLATLRENCAFFKAEGFEVGAWCWATWVAEPVPFTRITAASGYVAGPHACPADPAFREFAAGYMAELARTGVDLLLFDDDMKFGFYDGRDSLTCTCPHHMARIRELLGEDVTPALLEQKALAGPRNKYRSAWLRSKGDSLKEFCAAVRTAVDTVNPAARIGICAEMSLWDNDGVTAAALARILAGGTRPLLRLIGAPYWAVERRIGQSRLQQAVEWERMERSWCGEGIEILAEGDVYPRPRHACPAAYLEIFDTAIRAAGITDGIMKYAIDYTSAAGYEPGYLLRHERNVPLYGAIHAHFDGKAPCGVWVWEALHKLEDTDIPPHMAGRPELENLFYSPAARLLSDSTVPTVYEPAGTAHDPARHTGIAVFGENARSLPQQLFGAGLILDAAAAQLLTRRGLDVGLAEYGQRLQVTEEQFPAYCQQAANALTARRLALHPDAKVQSLFPVQGGGIPAGYTYQNANGQRFFVYCFEGHFNAPEANRNYLRGRQLADLLPWLCGAALPAYCAGHPDLYCLAKKGESGSLAVGLWNCFADDAIAPTVELGEKYTAIQFINCTGQLAGDRVRLCGLPPYGFAGFEVYK